MFGKVQLFTNKNTCSLFSYTFLKYYSLFHTKHNSSTQTLKMYNPNTNYSVIPRGIKNTDSFRLFFKDNTGPISPFHDIPLYSNSDENIVNMVVEVPRWTNAKMEISKEENLNPIKQDKKKGKLRYVSNVFPFHGYPWNYGALPQTWEDPDYVEPDIGTKGDKDPIDVCEIGSQVHKMGSVIPVKVLGALCLIDEGETDWKIIAVDVNDPLASQLNDIADLDLICPRLVKETFNWFRIYKIPDGKPENTFAFDNKAKNKVFALRVISDAHKQWQSMVQKGVQDLSCTNTTLSQNKHIMLKQSALEMINKTASAGPDNSVDESVNKWFYHQP